VGLTAQQLDQLEVLRVDVVDLPGVNLGETLGGRISIDADAAGYGWFIDPTPWDDVEFRRGDEAARNHVDLLSVVAHEMGHVLGFEHSDGRADDVMAAFLLPGARRLPAGSNTLGDEAIDSLALPLASSRNGNSKAGHDRLRAIGDMGLDSLGSGSKGLIDWNGRYVPPVVTDRVPGGQASTRMAQAWVRDFVVNLGVGGGDLGPNADISVAIPITEDANLTTAGV